MPSNIIYINLPALNVQLLQNDLLLLTLIQKHRLS